jgi:CubicO group peptidase (beta-lactamase class C family)
VDGGFTAAEIADDALIAARLKHQKPFWEPGTAYGYHALVIAALTGEVVRRVTGRSIQQVYAERVRDPYGLELYLGLPQALEARYRPSQPSPVPYPPMDPASLMAVAFTAPHGGLDAFVNDRNVRAHGQASAGGVGNARGVARLYAAAISTVDGRPPLLSEATAAEFAAPYALGPDLVTTEIDHFGLGFETVRQKYPYLGAGAFGHGGAAGAMGWADPASGVAYGYVRRRFAWPPGGGAAENEALGAAIVSAARAQR